MNPIAQISDAQKLGGLLHYARRGWYVFPCYEILAGGTCACGAKAGCAPGKHPRTPNGFKNATLDEDKIRSWHKRWPGANWAIACGLSRIVVVDVDPRNRGDETIAALQTEHGQLPDSVRACTGGDGQHYLYRFPADSSVKSCVLGDGVEIKAEGGYIIVAPSNHVKGVYRWDIGAHPVDVKTLALVPDWICRRAVSPAVRQFALAGPVTDGFLGAAFDAAGWLRRSLGTNKSEALCPWANEHTGGDTGINSSAVVFAPREGGRTGHFHCSHAHCDHKRSYQDVVDALPEMAKQQARAKLFAASIPVINNAEPGLEPDPSDEWTRSLCTDKDGDILKVTINAALMLAHLPEWRGCLQFDEFAHKIEWAKPPPAIVGLTAPLAGEPLRDTDITYVAGWFASARHISFVKQTIEDAVEVAARENSHHPVRDYFAALKWDRTYRSNWLHLFAGSEDTEYTRLVSRWWMISLVARVMRPGCQVDHMLVLEGPQGLGKSTIPRILAGERWHQGKLSDIRTKDAVAELQGRLIVEMGELSILSRSELEVVKDFMTRTVDSCRPAYGRQTVQYPRQCAFIGNTNKRTYLDDPTGARRFWPVPIREIDADGLTAARDQIWAEHVHYYLAGEHWWPEDDRVRALFAHEQEQRYQIDNWEPIIDTWTVGRTGFTINDLLAHLGIDPGKRQHADSIRIGKCLTRLGWDWRQMRMPDGRRERCYYRTDAVEFGQTDKNQT